jgi:hypothetical protein
MPNEHGEVWTYGSNPVSHYANIPVEGTESQDQIDAIVDHRPIGGDGMSSVPPN